MKVKFAKASVLLPIVVGVLFGALLFAVGATQDAPGACAIGLALAFGLSMLGVRNAGVIKKGRLAPILLFCYGLGGIFLDVVLLLDHEFEDKPWLSLIGFALGAVMIAAGGVLLRRGRGEK